MEKSFLYERRIEAGLSQSDIANALGYTVQLVSMWESGKSSPSLPVLSKYASLLQIDLEGIIYSKNIKKNNLCDELSFNEEEFAKNIKRLRKKKNLTQKQLADAISCNVNQLIKFEKGSSFPSIEQFIALAKLFKTKLDVLYFCLNYEPEDIQKEKKKTKTLVIVLPIISALSAVSLTFGVTLAVTNRSRNNSNDINNSNNINIHSGEDETKQNNVHWVMPDEITHTLGYYPQSLVDDPSLISILNNIRDTEGINEFDYAFYNGNYYEEVISKVTNPTSYEISLGADPQIKFNNNEPVIDDEPYWFKVEPINWRTIGEIDNGNIILISDVVIDAGIIYDHSSYIYKDSNVRNWLNNDFYNKAFYDCKDQLVSADIYNRSVSDYVTLLHANYIPPMSIGSSDYSRSKGALIDEIDDTLFSWTIGAEDEELMLFEDPETRCAFVLRGGNSMTRDSDAIENLSYSGIIPLIVINDNK